MLFVKNFCWVYFLYMIYVFNDCFLIIDFGSQVMQFIVCCLCEFSVYCEIYLYQNVMMEFVCDFVFKVVIFFGGFDSVICEGLLCVLQEIFSLGVLIFGICYGQQVMMYQLGGKVESGYGIVEFGCVFVML